MRKVRTTQRSSEKLQILLLFFYGFGNAAAYLLCRTVADSEFQYETQVDRFACKRSDVRTASPSYRGVDLVLGKPVAIVDRETRDWALFVFQNLNTDSTIFGQSRVVIYRQFVASENQRLRDKLAQLMLGADGHEAVFADREPSHAGKTAVLVWSLDTQVFTGVDRVFARLARKSHHLLPKMIGANLVAICGRRFRNDRMLHPAIEMHTVATGLVQSSPSTFGFVGDCFLVRRFKFSQSVST